MRIPYNCTNFPASSPTNLIGKHDLHTSWTDLIWANITVGKSSVNDILKHGWHSYAEIISKSYFLYTNLRQQSSLIKSSTLFDELDQTEKSAASYSLGMLLAKDFCHKRLATPWIFHTSHAAKHGVPVKKKSIYDKSLPDLIGISKAGDWIIIEAKGRSNSSNAAALVKAKNQTRKIRYINGTAPKLRVACQAYLKPCLSALFDDPEESASDAVDVNVNLGEAFEQYYKSVRAITQGSNQKIKIGDNLFQTIEIADIGVTIGVIDDIEKWLSLSKLGSIPSTQGYSTEYLRISETESVYSDGIYIRLDHK